MQDQLAVIFSSEGIDHWSIGDLSKYQYKMKFSKYHVISFYVPLNTGIMEEVIGEPTPSYFHHYRTVNQYIDRVSLKIAMALENHGYYAFPIAASQSMPGDNTLKGIFEHRTGAVLSGLGYIGKNGSLVTPTHGPKVRLGSIITDFVPQTYRPIMSDQCGSCTLCILKCPAIALYDDDPNQLRRVDARACSQFMHSAYQHIGRGAVCGICLTCCPKGKPNGK